MQGISSKGVLRASHDRGRVCDITQQGMCKICKPHSIAHCFSKLPVQGCVNVANKPQIYISAEHRELTSQNTRSTCCTLLDLQFPGYETRELAQTCFISHLVFTLLCLLTTFTNYTVFPNHTLFCDNIVFCCIYTLLYTNCKTSNSLDQIYDLENFYNNFEFIVGIYQSVFHYNFGNVQFYIEYRFVLNVYIHHTVWHLKSFGTLFQCLKQTRLQPGISCFECWCSMGLFHNRSQFVKWAFFLISHHFPDLLLAIAYLDFHLHVAEQIH